MELLEIFNISLELGVTTLNPFGYRGNNTKD
ncbi:MAG: hypothetical protein H6Q75_186 [Firmicutes bacterium]|nr:hypothetical protein [Bacillota bacterium]